jgi:hypothetical protein
MAAGLALQCDNCKAFTIAIDSWQQREPDDTGWLKVEWQKSKGNYKSNNYCSLPCAVEHLAEQAKDTK